MFSLTSRNGNRTLSCGTYPMPLHSGGQRETSSPRMKTVPLAFLLRPAMLSSRTVFPIPWGR